MFSPLEHDYIGLSEFPSMENSDNILSPKASTFSANNAKNCGLKTELSLGLPGSESPERKSGFGVTIFGKELEGKTQNGCLIGLVRASSSGAKRGFSDAIDGCGKWVFSINGKSESNLCKDGGNFTGVENKNTQKLVLLKEMNLPSSPEVVKEKQLQVSGGGEHGGAPAAKEQVVGWPPIRSFRKNSMASISSKISRPTEDKSPSACLYVKVSMDGAPYLRKVDLQIYRSYMELSSALEKMFSCFITGDNDHGPDQYGSHGHDKQDGTNESHSTDYPCNSEYVLTYEDKDGDWMLVGDVPWKMFTGNCRKLRIMKGSEAIGLTPKCS